MKITVKLLKKWEAPYELIKWFKSQDERDSVAVMRKLLEEDHVRLANWLIVRLLPIRNRLKYALYAAELVYHLWEKTYPDIIRKKLDLVKKYIDDPTSVSIKELQDAASDAAASRADDYSGATYCYASRAVAYAAAGRDDAAAADAYATANYAAEYAYAFSVDNTATLQKIVEYGISLLEGKQ